MTVVGKINRAWSITAAKYLLFENFPRNFNLIPLPIPHQLHTYEILNLVDTFQVWMYWPEFFKKTRFISQTSIYPVS